MLRRLNVNVQDGEILVPNLGFWVGLVLLAILFLVLL